MIFHKWYNIKNNNYNYQLSPFKYGVGRVRSSKEVDEELERKYGKKKELSSEMF